MQDNNNIEIERIEDKQKIEPVIKLASYELFSELTEKQQRDRSSKTMQLLRQEKEKVNSATKWI